MIIKRLICYVRCQEEGFLNEQSHDEGANVKIWRVQKTVSNGGWAESQAERVRNKQMTKRNWKMKTYLI